MAKMAALVHLQTCSGQIQLECRMVQYSVTRWLCKRTLLLSHTQSGRDLSSIESKKYAVNTLLGMTLP